MSYHLTDNTRFLLQCLVAQKNGVKCVLLEGAPGTGKTSLGEHFADTSNAKVVYYQCHHWTTDEELHYGIDIGGVITQDAERVYKPGVLLDAARLSVDKPVVLIIDEIDKAPERAEVLLLDFLQNGRIKLADKTFVTANLNNMTVFITSNQVRPLLEATKRRCMRFEMGFLPENVERDLLRKKTGANTNLIRLVVQMANVVRQEGETATSLQEMAQFLECAKLVTNVTQMRMLVSAWLTKESGDVKALRDKYTDPGNALWAEVSRERNRR